MQTSSRAGFSSEPNQNQSAVNEPINRVGFDMKPTEPFLGRSVLIFMKKTDDSPGLTCRVRYQRRLYINRLVQPSLIAMTLKRYRSRLNMIFVQPLLIAADFVISRRYYKHVAISDDCKKIVVYCIVFINRASLNPNRNRNNQVHNLFLTDLAQVD